MAESLLLYLMQSTMAIAVSGGVIFLIRRVFHKNLTPEICYRLWFLLLVLAAVPFFMALFPWLNRLRSCIHALSSASRDWHVGDFNGSDAVFTAPDLLNDFSVSVSRRVPGVMAFRLTGIWLCGVVFFAALTAASAIRVHRLKATALPVRNEMLQNVFSDCVKELEIRRAIPLRSVSQLSSPVTAGILAPCVLLPESRLLELPENEIRCILLHELQHYKRQDILSSLLFRIFLSLYWFHPVVWLAVKEMESDREIACDAAVLGLLDGNGVVDYGTALLHFAASLSHLPFGQAAGIGGSKKEIRKRISHIAAYQQGAGKRNFKSLLIFLAAGSLVLSTMPPASVLAFSKERYSGQTAHVVQEDLSRFFGDLEGSFVLYNISKKQYLIYNEEDARTRVSPNSTYKIYSALMALDAGVITSKNNHMVWDGEAWPFDSWNCDQTLKLAMKNSVNWYFKNLDRSQGMDSIKQYLTRLSYGNLNVSGGLSRFWLESSLKISPLEQVNLLAGLMENTLPFSESDMETVKDALRLASDGTASLYGKTGTGTIEGKDTNGWFIGFVETEQGTAAFAVHLQGKDEATGARAGEIALRILKEKNIYDGN